MKSGLLRCAVAGTLTGAAFFASLPARAADIAFFEKNIRPVLVDRCYECHSTGKKIKGGLLLDTLEGMLKGGDIGPAIVPGDPAKSLLITAIQHKNDDLKMPPKGMLSPSEIANFVKWVEAGAPAPKETDSAAAGTENPDPYDFEAARKSWAFSKPHDPPIPQVQNASWVKNEIDRFVLARLEEKHLSPAKPAAKRALIRRATYDLTGLPPTPEEIDAFLQDDSPEAFARVVDRLLASPRYGERWGRHWLDTVRYTDSFDSRGIGGEADVPEAYRYRDWVVQAFNRDLPYDQFITEQLAGDILCGKTSGTFRPDGIIATGMYAIGEWGTGDADKEKMMTDIIDDQIDVTGKAFLGLTLACARCHDHKFDPILAKDYYALAGIFFSSTILPSPGVKTGGSPVLRIPLASAEELNRRKEREARIAQLEKDIQATLDTNATATLQSLLPRLGEYLSATWTVIGEKKELSSVAAERNLEERLLRHWVEILSGDTLALLTKPVKNVAGKAGLHALQNPNGSDTPSVTVNSTDQEISFVTIKLPPRTLAVHPSPNAGVAVGWRSPVSGKINIRGKLADADPNCGNGIEWELSLRRTSSLARLAQGHIDNGGNAPLSAESPISVEVAKGEIVQLAILPRKDYSCDTTVVELEIATVGDEAREWNLARDVTPDLHAGNPHQDQFGNAAWHFYDLGREVRIEAPEGSVWHPFAQAFQDRRGDDIQRLAAEVAKEVNSVSSDAKDNPTLAKALASPKGILWTRLQKDETLLAASAREHLRSWRGELAELRKNTPPTLAVAHGFQEGGVPQSVYEGFKDARLQIRGRYDRLGDTVPRGFPRVLAGDQPPAIASGNSGRMELARWIASPENPLTARVMVNRLWQHHFGEGIVRTPNNFGKLGTPPTHPELLDHLAHRFIESGWSIKAMHRRIMLSATYQQSSIPRPETLQTDPENKLFGHMNRRRLEAEALRDSLLFVAGQLDLKMSGPASRELENKRRTLYLMTIRSDRSNYRSLFDAADASASVDKRVESTVAPQALFLLNHPFVLAQAKTLAEKVTETDLGNARDRIDWLYQRLYGRPATEREFAIAEAAISTGAPDEKPTEQWESLCQVLLCANEFVYID